MTEMYAKRIRASVIDPEIGLNIVDLGLIYGVEVDEDTIRHRHDADQPRLPGRPADHLRREEHRQAQAFPEASEVSVNIVWQPFWSPEMMSEWAKEELGIF